jgi:hypothetical protein
MTENETTDIVPVIMGMLDAVLIAVAFIRGASAWVYLVILLGWFAGVHLCRWFFSEANRRKQSTHITG